MAALMRNQGGVDQELSQGVYSERAESPRR
jgi:hypothetical protein